ncbi:hypothetical protein [Phocaeicola coprocola]|jgi:hypothetical protein
MKKELLLTAFLIICLAAFSQNRPSLSFTEKEELEGYEFIENIDYLLVHESNKMICTAFNWKVYLYGKPFGNTYIFKICVRGEKSNRNKSIYTLTKNGDKYVRWGEFDSNYNIVYTDVDVSSYKYKTKVLSSDDYGYIMYLNLPF